MNASMAVAITTYYDELWLHYFGWQTEGNLFLVFHNHRSLPIRDIDYISEQHQRLKCDIIVKLYVALLLQKSFMAAYVLPHESSYTHNLDIASSHDPSLPQTWKY